jgi:hypothetical protein
MTFHRVFLGRGFDQAAPAEYVFNGTISANTTNYDIRAAAISAGWDGVTPLTATITINSGVFVGSTSTSGFSIDSNSSGSFPVGTTISIVNNGTIVGCGGDGGAGGNATSTAPSTQGVTAGSTGGTGGTAIRARCPISITNNGIISAGGGGGGGGGAAARASSSVGNACEGGGGGGGGGVSPGTGASKGVRTDTTTDLFTYYQNATNGTNGQGNGLSGATGGVGTYCGIYTLTGSGFKYTWYGRAWGGNGGSGGSNGSAGNNGGAGYDYSDAYSFTTSTYGSGGSAGYYVNGYTNITWVATGTRYGTYTG